ncbi:sensor histidine kinase [Rhodococcus sp. LW-XY12]|uniref:sensor histidine kinase n=1 Tax=Rhodococcus sp. LW-XY12 TaxID=2856851 RepID=UPI001C58DB56|nr:histidine kinase [Rhodococcus sp. LW-XY12]QXU53195.1 sensor histidine kinase [Rhodococcus sp. LW-XY12]
MDNRESEIRVGFVNPRYNSLLVALAYFAGGSLLYALDLGVLVEDRPPQPLWVWLVLLACVCAPMTMRRTRPLLALLLGTVPVLVDLVVGPSLPVWIAYGDLLYTATLFGSARTSRFLERAPLVPIVVGAVALGVYFGELRIVVWAVSIAALVIVVPIWWARSVRTHRDAAEIERARAEALSRVAELDRRAAITTERQRLARDLHDVVAGHLSSIAIQSEAALRLRDSDPDRALTVLESVRSGSVAALQEMQSMVRLLRSDDTDEITTAGRLADLEPLTASARAAGTSVRIDGRPPADLDAEVDLTAYRIVQETLTNAVKHAPGRPVTLRFDDADGRLGIEVVNPIGDPDTPDPSPARGAGHGLRNIAERAAAVGGYARSGRDGNEWRTYVQLPIANRSTT